MKPYTQEFNVCSQSLTITTYKISRENNEEADLLARQAVALNLDIIQPFQTFCSNIAHES
jgi:hypothetical protein